MSWEGILKYPHPLLLSLEGPDLWWPLKICVIKVKPCKIDLLLNWSTTKLFSASKLCSVPFYKVLKICGKILVNDFLLFWKEFRLGKWNFQG